MRPRVALLVLIMTASVVGAGLLVAYDGGGGNGVGGADAEPMGPAPAAGSLAPHAKPNGTLVYVSKDATRRWPLFYVVNGDGTGQRLLARVGDDVSELVRSPDGRRVAFVRDGEIYVDHRRLTEDGLNESPVWSPDGRAIGFWKREGYDTYVMGFDGSQTRERAQGFAFYVVGADGSHERQVTSVRAVAWPLTWSPDGRTILFVAEPGASVASLMMGSTPLQQGIYAQNVAAYGGGVRLLTEELIYNHSPVWSPDGRRIAFEGHDDGDRSESYVMNADGSDQQGLTEDGLTVSPVWSPDSERIAFVHDGDIHVMDADGSHQQQLTEDGLNGQPVWSPDSRTIAFVHDGEIHVIDADGKDRRRLTRRLHGTNSLSWSPYGGFIAFAAGESAGSDTEIFVVDETGTRQWRLTRNEADDTDPIWPPLTGARP